MVGYIAEFDAGLEEQQNDPLIDGWGDNELSVHHQIPHILQDLDWNDETALIQCMDAGPRSEHARQLAQLHKQMILFKRRRNLFASS